MLKLCGQMDSLRQRSAPSEGQEGEMKILSLKNVYSSIIWFVTYPLLYCSRMTVFWHRLHHMVTKLVFSVITSIYMNFLKAFT